MFCRLSQAIMTMLQNRKGRFFRKPKGEAPHAITNQIQKGKGRSDNGGKQLVVLPSQQGYKSKILRHFYERCKSKNVKRQRLYALWNDGSAQTAKEYGYQNVADVGADKRIVNIQSDTYFRQKERTKNRGIYDSGFFHQITALGVV